MYAPTEQDICHKRLLPVNETIGFICFLIYKLYRSHIERLKNKWIEKGKS